MTVSIKLLLESGFLTSHSYPKPLNCVVRPACCSASLIANVDLIILLLRVFAENVYEPSVEEYTATGLPSES